MLSLFLSVRLCNDVVNSIALMRAFRFRRHCCANVDEPVPTSVRFSARECCDAGAFSDVVCRYGLGLEMPVLTIIASRVSAVVYRARKCPSPPVERGQFSDRAECSSDRGREIFRVRCCCPRESVCAVRFLAFDSVCCSASVAGGFVHFASFCGLLSCGLFFCRSCRPASISVVRHVADVSGIRRQRRIDPCRLRQRGRRRRRRWTGRGDV